MKLSELLTAIEADLKTAGTLSEAKDIALSPGRFDASEIGRNSFRAPALRVTFLGAPRNTPLGDGARRYDIALAVFILTSGRGRAIEGLDLMEAVAEVVEINRFSAGTGIGIPENLRLEALYSSQNDEKGVSIHSVSWTQKVRLGASCGLGAASDPAATIPEEVGTEQDIDITYLPGDGP